MGAPTSSTGKGKATGRVPYPRAIMSILPRHRLRVCLLVVGCLVVSACTSEGAPTTDRVEAIARARDAVVGPAQDLGTAAAEVASRLDEVVARPAGDTIQAARSALDHLADARDAVVAVELDDQTPDVQAAATALDDAAASAGTVEDAAAGVLEAAELASTADDRLADLVAAWDEAGSRSQLIARLQEVAAEADALATGGVGQAPADCPGPVETREAAAAFVAEATRELEALVVARDGLAFDERRAELAEAPFGVDDGGLARGPGASIDPASCPAVGQVESAATEVASALRALQEALNPDDLSG